MLSKAAKNDIIEHYSEVFKANPSVLLVEYKGLSVTEIEGLRSNLRGADTKLAVVKNTLLKKAAKDTDFEQLNDLLVGPTAIAVCESDAAAAAKVFVDTAKDLPALVIKGGVVEGTVVGAEEITAISKLPSRQEMMAQLLGALTSPMSNLLGSLNQLQAKLVYALEAVKEKKESTPAASDETPEEAKAVEAKEESKEAPEEPKAEAKDEKPVEEKAEEKAETKEEAKADTEDSSEPEAKAEEADAEVKEEAAEETQESAEAQAQEEPTEEEAPSESEAEDSKEEEKEES